MNNAAQLVFGLMSGVEKFRPYAAGDVICKADGRRYLIETVSDNLDGGVYVCLTLNGDHVGATAVVLEREIAWRSC